MLSDAVTIFKYNKEVEKLANSNNFNYALMREAIDLSADNLVVSNDVFHDTLYNTCCNVFKFKNTEKTRTKSKGDEEASVNRIIPRVKGGNIFLSVL